MCVCVCVCPSTDGEYLTFTRYEPIGVCGQIIPVSIKLPTSDMHDEYKWTEKPEKQIRVTWLSLKEISVVAGLGRNGLHLTLIYKRKDVITFQMHLLKWGLLAGLQF